FEHLQNEFFWSGSSVFFSCCLFVFIFLRKNGFAFPKKKSGCHEEKVTCDLEVEFFHENDVAKVLIRDLRNRDSRNIELVGLNQIEQKIKRTFKLLKLNLNRDTMCHLKSSL